MCSFYIHTIFIICLYSVHTLFILNSTDSKTPISIDSQEMIRRKQEQSKRTVKPGKGIGASSGVRTKNKHLAEFQNMKEGFNKRKENIVRGARGAPAGDRGRGRGSVQQPGMFTGQYMCA